MNARFERLIFFTTKTGLKENSNLPLVTKRSFENPMILERISRQPLQDRVLCEGAAALLLTADGTYSDWKNFDYNATESYYGISHQIITQTQNKGE